MILSFLTELEEDCHIYTDGFVIHGFSSKQRDNYFLPHPSKRINNNHPPIQQCISNAGETVTSPITSYYYLPWVELQEMNIASLSQNHLQ
jgi:hypothetical protein